jgi:phosphate transport system substrate-binding protein
VKLCLAIFQKNLPAIQRKKRARPTTDRFGQGLAVCAAVMCLAGCTSIDQAQQGVRGIFRPLSVAAATPSAKRADQITQEELEQLTYGFADRYLTYIVSATDAIERDNDAATQRRRVHQVRLVQVGAIYDIVTNADPFTRLLDLILVVTLQSQKWIEEDQAERWFGTRAQPLIVASRKAREDIWQIGARVMTPDQLEVLDYLIWDWRQRNSDVELVSYVRFDDFAAARGKSIIANVKSGAGLLAPVGEATKAVDEMRMLGERAFFYAKRLPILTNWQVRAAVDDVFTESEMRELLNQLRIATRALNRLPQDIAREREAIFAALNGKQPMFQSLSSQYRSAISDTTSLVSALTNLTDSSQQTLGALDRVAKAISANGRPFDVREYGATIEKFTAALQEANRLAGTTVSVVENVQPQKLDALVKGGSAQAETFVAHILKTAFWRGVALIVVFFVTLAIYRTFSLWLHRRTGTMKAVLLALACISSTAYAQAPRAVRPTVDLTLEDDQRTVDIVGVLRTVGSSTLSNLLFRWGAEFRRLYPSVDLQVTGGGSETAVPALIEGRADLGPMSRPMSDAELERFRANFGYPPTRLTVAMDAIAVYVNKHNPLTRVSFRELDAIFSDTRNWGGVPIRTWGQLGLTGDWAERPILLKGPSPAQGLYGVFRTAVLAGGKYRLDMRPEPVESSIVQAVATEDGAIGFASHFLAAARTKTLAVTRKDGGPYVSPTVDNAVDGSYPLARKLFIYLNRPPGTAVAPALRELLRFICSGQGQEIAARDGNFPLNAELAARECAAMLE